MVEKNLFEEVKNRFKEIEKSSSDEQEDKLEEKLKLFKSILDALLLNDT